MLTIDHLHTTYTFPRGLPQAASLRTRLDRIARERLPAVASDVLRAELADEDAVYRIRDLDIALHFDTANFSESDIAGRWAQAMIRSVYVALATAASSRVVRYDSHAHYLAAFFADLVAGRAWSRWMYDEFHPLRDVPAGQVMAQILGARPALLVPVAALLRQRGQLEGLLRQLRNDDVEVIWQRGLGFGETPAAHILTGQLSGALARAAVEIAWERGSPGDRARNALRLYLAVALDTPALAGDTTLGGACRHLALLHSLDPALIPALLRHVLDAPATPRPPDLAGALNDASPETVAWLQASLATPNGRRYVTKLMQLLPQAGTSRDAAPSAPRPMVPRYSTGHAGLALLLPAIRELGLYETVGRPGIYQLLLGLVGTAREPAARRDPAITAMAGIPERDAASALEIAIDWPVDRAPDHGQEPATTNRFYAPTPRTSVALLVLRRFASRLHGFETSSPGYLAAQFINLPGTVGLPKGALEVTLGRLPLGVVLRMAGYGGDQGPIPWLAGRRLLIGLPDD